MLGGLWLGWVREGGREVGRYFKICMGLWGEDYDILLGEGGYSSGCSGGLSRFGVFLVLKERESGLW